MKNILSVFILLIFFQGCSQENSQNAQKGGVAVYAHGKVNQIEVIADSTLWKGAVGDSFFYYFAAPYILLPQPESIFDIKHLTPEQLAKQPAKKEFRTILILADLNDDNSPATALIKADLGATKIEEIRMGKGYNTTVGMDKWAKDQLLFYISGFGEEKLIENISKNFPPIARKINEKDMKSVEATAFQAGENSDLEAEVKAKYDLNLKVPGDFKLAKYSSQTNTLWLRRDDREIVANIIIHKRPYTSKEQLTKKGIKEIRNEVSKIVTTRQPNTYMQINDEDLPLFVENKTLNNLYTVQAKGIWDIVNDFMGGPFISNLMLDTKKNELIFVDGFIYAPGKEKRNYMQEMELILSSASI
ncbi:MAG: DUF4837 family protein [Lewinellaceae bacterium]|nr:DUF4837 family protein [Saprospiraceae bacterium]MCB9338653.1 DUF4837 family protein [Lewinellaceae bacterium]